MKMLYGLKILPARIALIHTMDCQKLKGEMNMLSLSSVMIGSDRPSVLALFYEKVFMKPADLSDDNWYKWRVGNAFMMIGLHSEIKDKAREPQRVILNFESYDVKKDFERIRNMGATVIANPYEMGGNWIATLADPDGNYFQLTLPFEVEN